MANEGTQIEGEGTGSSLSPTVHEDKARKDGWKPLEDWKGDPADWVDAKEFVGRQHLYDRIKDLSHSISEQRKQFETDFGRVSKHMAETEKRAYEKAIKDLRAERRVAIEEKDPDTVEAIDKDIALAQSDLAKAEQLAQQSRQQNSGETPALKQWKEDNPWFEKDKELQQEAMEIGTGRAALRPNDSQRDVLEYVSKRIKKLFPEKFDDEEERTVEKVASKVEGGNRQSSVASGAKKGRLSRADLTDQQVSVMKTLIKRNVLADAAKKNNRTQEAEYIAQLESTLTV